jgi:4-hydroxy-4-methyl-2-oxoglutarate aldolase
VTIDLGLVRSKLFTAVISDAMDAAGITKQAMRPFIRPLDEGLVMVGRARTGLYSVTYDPDEYKNPYEVEIALVDDLQPGEVAVLGCNGPTERIAPWGGLLSTAAVHRKAAGCVTDGLVRDIKHIRSMNFPVFHGGIGPLDSKGRGVMVKRDIPIECGGVRVESGDLVFGDADGVVVVPQAACDAVIGAALKKIEAEDNTARELANGVSLGEVYARYGTL